MSAVSAGWWLAAAGGVLLAGGPQLTRRTRSLVGVGRLAGHGTAGRAGERHADGRVRALLCARLRPGAGVPVGEAALALALGLALGGVGGWLLGGPVLAVPGSVLALTAWAIGRGALAARARRRDDGTLLRSVRVLAAELTSGAGPPAALRAAAAMGGVDSVLFTAAAELAGRGGEASRVLLAGRPGVRALGYAWRIGEQAGAPLAVVLDRVAGDLATAADQRRVVAVALSGPRASATLLAGLPLLGIALGWAMAAHPLHFLLARPTGRLVCAAGVLLDLGGIGWMARILRRAEAA